MSKHSQGITVLLPTRRTRAKILRSALRSTLGALSEVDKILLLADPSDPYISSLVQNSFSDRLTVIPMDGDIPLATKLNQGLEKVETPFVARMDSDDICLPWRFKRQLYLARKFDAVVLSTAVIFGKELRPFPLLPQLPIPLTPDEFVEALFFGNPGIHPTLLLRSDILRDVDGYRNVPGEDLDLWLRLVSAGISIMRDWVPSLLYRYSTTSMSHGAKNSLSENADTHANQIRSTLSPFGPIEPNQIPIVRSELLQKRKVSWKTRASLINFGLNN